MITRVNDMNNADYKIAVGRVINKIASNPYVNGDATKINMGDLSKRMADAVHNQGIDPAKGSQALRAYYAGARPGPYVFDNSKFEAWRKEHGNDLVPYDFGGTKREGGYGGLTWNEYINALKAANSDLEIKDLGIPYQGEPGTAHYISALTTPFEGAGGDAWHSGLNVATGEAEAWAIYKAISDAKKIRAYNQKVVPEVVVDMNTPDPATGRSRADNVNSLQKAKKDIHYNKNVRNSRIQDIKGRGIKAYGLANQGVGKVIELFGAGIENNPYTIWGPMGTYAPPHVLYWSEDLGGKIREAGTDTRSHGEYMANKGSELVSKAQKQRAVTNYLVNDSLRLQGLSPEEVMQARNDADWVRRNNVSRDNTGNLTHPRAQNVIAERTNRASSGDPANVKLLDVANRSTTEPPSWNKQRGMNIARFGIPILLNYGARKLGDWWWGTKGN